jgi:rod shape-determining protein MreB
VFLFGRADIAIDLGTSSVIIYVKGKGIVLREPSVVALDKSSGGIVAVGEQALRMIGRAPQSIAVVRPLRDGVISDYDVTVKMLQHFLKSIYNRRLFFKPRVVVCVPSGVTEVEKRSVVDATMDAGASSVRLIEEPIAAAIGAGIDISLPQGSMVVDIGGGTCDIAVISMGKAVASSCSKTAGDSFDEAIVRHMRRQHNLLIGERTAENLKIQLGGAVLREQTQYMDVSGRSLASGMPCTVSVSSDELTGALYEPAINLLDAIHQVLERIPPELAADIYESGIVFTGGGALLYGLDVLASDHMRLPCKVAENAQSCVAIGTGRALEDIDALGDAIFEYRRGGSYLSI